MAVQDWIEISSLRALSLHVSSTVAVVVAALIARYAIGFIPDAILREYLTLLDDCVIAICATCFAVIVVKSILKIIWRDWSNGGNHGLGIVVTTIR